MIIPTNIQEYRGMLDNHDWLHEWADDSKDVRSGAKREKELQAMAEALGSNYIEMFFEFKLRAVK